MITSTPAAGRCPSGWSSIRTRRRASSEACRCATTSRSRSPSSSSSSSTASEVRAAGRRGAGAPPAEARLQIGKAMPRIPFQKPKKVEWEILSDRYGRLVAEPFEKGYALTVGNSLRRTLLAVVPVAAPAGALALDAAYSPITRVSYNVEMSRLGKITDYEKLVVEVWTNGSVSPDDALTRASTYLKEHFRPLAAGVPREDEEAEGAEGEAFLRDALGKTLEELALPARAINALKNAELNLVVDLVQKNEGDLEHVKNLGEKSIDEIKTALAALGLSLGMRIDPNVLGALGRGSVR